MLRIALLACAALLAAPLDVSAQADPQRQRCLQDAAARGLAPAGGESAAARRQRQAFMTQCMARGAERPAAPPAIEPAQAGSYQ